MGRTETSCSKCSSLRISSVSTWQFRIGGEGEESEIATAQEAVNTEILKSADADVVNSLVSSLRTTLASGNRFKRKS